MLSILADHDPGLLLDIPAGTGPVIGEARKAGWRTVEVDLFPPDGFRGVRADACAPLPFADGAFDCVLSMEGIEHFENQAAFVRECSRVLRPGGLLIITTPNVMHISGRLSHFMTGQRVLKRGFINEQETYKGADGQWILHGHAFLVDVFRLRYFLRIAGMRVGEIRRGNWSTSSLLMAPLIPVFQLAARFAVKSRHRIDERDPHGKPIPASVAEDIVRVASSTNLLLSSKLIITAYKES